MDYTRSDAFVTHAATGSRMHQETLPVPTLVGSDDMNSVIWSLMEIVKDAGLSGVEFDPDVPDSYTVLLKALQKGVQRFDPTLNYTLRTLGWAKLQGAINVRWFADADPTGVANSTAVFVAAALLGHAVYVPKGLWAVNWVIPRKIVVIGEGTEDSVFKHFNTAQAQVTYRGGAGQQWTAGTEFRNIGFQGTGRVGVGYTAGATNQADYQPGYELHGNVRFIGCRFSGLDKGAQFPFGNIGKTFIDCSWSDNNYHVYCLDNKVVGGASMHAGCLTILGGYWGGGKCGLYVHNRTEGFGGIEISGLIAEFGQLVAYVDTNNTFTPSAFRSVWNEGNGTTRGSGGNVTIDQWVGAVRSNQDLPLRSLIFAGAENHVLWEGGFLTDVAVTASDGVVEAYGARVECLTAFSGGAFVVSGANAVVRLHRPYTKGGLPVVDKVLVVDSPDVPSVPVGSSGIDARARGFVTGTRMATTASGSAGVSMPLTLPAAYGSGSFTGSGTVVADGATYPLCNQFIVPFTSSSQAVRLEGSAVVATAGWWVMTVDVKYVSGADVTLSLWDRDQVQAVLGLAGGATGRWRTVGGLFYSPGGQTWYLDIGGASASATFRLGAYQCRRFDSKEQAQAYLASHAYAEPLAVGFVAYDPPSLAAGASTTTTVPCSGAQLGYFAEAAFSSDLQDVTVSAWVSAADTVKVRLRNDSGAAVDLAAGTLRVKASHL